MYIFNKTYYVVKYQHYYGHLWGNSLLFDMFDSLQVKGKIVVFNEKWLPGGYGPTVAYRDYAAVRTAKYGGVASLVRSVTPFSIYSPHTGWQDYQDGMELRKPVYNNIIPSWSY